MPGRGILITCDWGGVTCFLHYRYRPRRAALLPPLGSELQVWCEQSRHAIAQARAAMIAENGRTLGSCHLGASSFHPVSFAPSPARGRAPRHQPGGLQAPQQGEAGHAVEEVRFLRLWSCAAGSDSCFSAQPSARPQPEPGQAAQAPRQPAQKGLPSARAPPADRHAGSGRARR